jgi:hypothetical protein
MVIRKRWKLSEKKEREIIMRKKLIYLISFIVALSLVSITYGDGFLIGNFEGGSMDGWGPETPSNPHITLTFSTNGATLDGNSLKIADSTGNDFDRAVAYSLVANNDVNEFRNNRKVSLDLTRIYGAGNWGNYVLGWSEFHMVIEAGSTDANVGKGVWAKGWELTQIANWGSWNGDGPKTFIYDYSTLLNQIDFNNLTYLGIILCTNWGGYSPGGVYYVDNVKLVGDGTAYDPSPADHAVDVNTTSTLGWTKGTGATSQDVYFGTNFNDVNDANRTNPLGVLKSQGQMANTYNPTLALYTTYYWRIDEVNSLGGIRKGEVWDFMTAFTGKGVVIGDWENGMNGWEPTWQGNPTFSYSATKGVTSGSYSLGVQIAKLDTDDPAYWIIQRRGVLDLTNMKLQFDVTMFSSEWSGQTVTIGPLCVQTDADPDHTWRPYDVSGTDRNNGTSLGASWNGTGNWYATYTVDFTGPTQIADGSNTYSDWANTKRMTMLLALQTGGQGSGHIYLDNARLVNVKLAGNPLPATLATDVSKTPTLSWVAGMDATSHDVYFGTDATAVTNATTSNPLGVFKGNQAGTTYSPGLLAKNVTYYWRIDEQPGPWKGMVWSFTVQNFELVDDFESYLANPGSVRLYNNWIKGDGGTVGYPNFNYAETTIVHGGLQSMPFDYNNVGAFHDSNATRTFTGDPCDWTANGSKSLELWYRGWPAAVGSFTGAGPYTITASGEDVWDVPALRGTGYHDECHYAYKQITGAAGPLVTIIAKVDSVSSNTSPWAKAGVMIRQSLDPNSKNAFMCITPEMGAAFQYRALNADVSTSYDYQLAGYEFMADINAPYWVKLEFYTDSGGFWAYYSANGTNWVPVESDTPYLALPVYVGLAVTAHNASATCTAEFSNVSITAPGLTISSWSHQDIGIKSNVAAPLYVTLQDSASPTHTATVTNTDPNAVLQNTWQAWDIALSDFTGVDLTKIKKITLGVGPATPNGTGTLYFDDIRLYPPRCMPNRTPDFNGDCFVDYDDLQILASNWLSSPVDPNIDLNKDNKINFKDFAILASQWLSAAVWPY